MCIYSKPKSETPADASSTSPAKVKTTFMGGALDGQPKSATSQTTQPTIVSLGCDLAGICSVATAPTKPTIVPGYGLGAPGF